MSQFSAVPCFQDREATVPGWLIEERIQLAKANAPTELRYYWSNSPADAKRSNLAEIVYRQHWNDHFVGAAMTHYGWRRYQGRSWPGFHRHAVAVFMAYSFQLWCRAQPQ